MHVLTTNFNGNPNIGLYGFATNKYCLLGREVPDKAAQQIGHVLNVPVHKITVCGTSMIGVFCAGNETKLLLPHIAFEAEVRQIERLGIPCELIKTRLTALGNNILCNDKGALVNPGFSAEAKKRIRQALDVRLNLGMIAELPTVGSVSVVNKNCAVLHQHAKKLEQKQIEQLLGVPTDTATINRGSPYIRSGVLANDTGLVVSDQSWGPEIGYVDNALFLRQ